MTATGDSNNHADRSMISARLDTGLADPPVGVLLIELQIDLVWPDQPADEALVERAIDRVRRELATDDIVLVTGPNSLAVIRTGLTAPAEAEGLAYRLHAGLSTPIAVGHDGGNRRVAIGVAVSRSGDSGPDLLRYVEHAIGDARMLGADRVVAFDDQDRDLLLPEP